MTNEKAKIKNIARRADFSEKEIERYLVSKCKAHGWPCLKYSNTSEVGYPDRLVCLPRYTVCWVELKSKGRQPTKLQKLRHEQLTLSGQQVFIADCKEDIDTLTGILERQTKYCDDNFL